MNNINWDKVKIIGLSNFTKEKQVSFGIILEDNPFEFNTHVIHQSATDKKLSTTGLIKEIIPYSYIGQINGITGIIRTFKYQLDNNAIVSHAGCENQNDYIVK